MYTRIDFRTPSTKPEKKTIPKNANFDGSIHAKKMCMRAEVNYHAQKVDLYRIFKNDKSKFQFFRKLTIALEQRFKQFRKKVLN